MLRLQAVQEARSEVFDLVDADGVIFWFVLSEISMVEDDSVPNNCK